VAISDLVSARAPRRRRRWTATPCGRLCVGRHDYGIATLWHGHITAWPPNRVRQRWRKMDPSALLGLLFIWKRLGATELVCRRRKSQQSAASQPDRREAFVTRRRELSRRLLAVCVCSTGRLWPRHTQASVAFSPPINKRPLSWLEARPPLSPVAQ